MFDIKINIHILGIILKNQHMQLRNLFTLCLLLILTSGFAQLQITSPLSSQTISEKSILPITWTPGSDVEFVKIEYLNNGFTNIIELSTPNDGSYDFDMHGIEFSMNSISIKITAVNNPRNYTIARNISIQDCPINVVVIAPNVDMCIGQSVTFVNNTTNANSYKWILDEKTLVSTSKDYTFTPTTLDKFNIRLEASNGTCYDYVYFDIENKSSEVIDNPCSNETVYEEMMIFDNNETMRMTSKVPVVIDEPVTVMALRITHKLENIKEYMYWDWSSPAMPGFNLSNIDHSVKDEITVTWTSLNPEGTIVSGELYTLVYEITGAPAPELEPLTIGNRRRASRIAETIKPTAIGNQKLKYRKIVAQDPFNGGSKVKTTGIILTKDDVIILE